MKLIERNKMYKNIVFDYGMVLVRFDGLEISRHFMSEEEAAVFAPVFFDRLYWDRLDRGTLDCEEMLDDVLRRLPNFSREVARRVFYEWFHVLPPIDGMPELVAALREKGHKLYLISDISKIFAEHAHRQPIIRDFDGLVMSGVLGITKPNPAIFRHLLDTYRLDPAECIFIDDRLSNVEGAEFVGMHGYHFDGNARKLARYLGVEI